MVFGAGERSEEAGHAHESPRIMIWPLRILAVFSVIGGIIGIENVFERQFGAENAGEATGVMQQLLEPFNASPTASLFGLFAVMAGFAMAYGCYRRRLVDPLPEKLGWLSRAMQNRFYFDELYERILIPCTQEAAAKLAAWIDRWIIGGLAVRGSQGTTELIGRALRLLQNGSIQTYAFMLVAGVALVLYWVLLR